MPNFRCTRRVLDRFGLEPSPELPTPEGVLGDWYVNLLNLGSRRYLLCVSDVSMLPVILPARKADFPGRFPLHLEALLLALGIPPGAAREEAFRGWPAAEGTVRVGKTASRSVLGVMNDFSLMASHVRDLDDPLALSLFLARSYSRPIGDAPDRKTRELFGLAGEGAGFRVPKDELQGLEMAPSAPVAAGPARTGGAASGAAGAPAARGARRGTLDLRILVEETDPLVWRRVRASERATLRDLHRVIQVAMGWGDLHLHHFEVEGVRYGDPRDEPPWSGPAPRDEGRVRLGALGLEEGDRFHYAYDYGDDWQLRVEVEARMEDPDKDPLPAWMLDGERAGPPEDCGGVDGLRELLEALADPWHPEHQATRTWVGPDFDPAAFSPAQANDFLWLLVTWGALGAGKG